MKSAGTLRLVIMIAATTASAQTTVGLQSAVASPPLSIRRASCPLDLHAQHARTLAQSRATSGMQGDVFPTAPAQRISLTLTNLEPHEVVSAFITIRGYGVKDRYVPLSGVQPTPDVARSIHLELTLKGNSSGSRELSLTRFTAVAVIDIDAVTYADGSSWHASYPGACSATPDLVMPVVDGR